MRELLVFGDKTFKITIPDDAKVTFGPWSPPSKSKPWGSEEKAGTLRIYRKTKENIIACFSPVSGFRDLSLGYCEQVAKEEGATIWKSDAEGYVREDKVSRKNEWEVPQLPPATPDSSPKKKRGK